MKRIVAYPLLFLILFLGLVYLFVGLIAFHPGAYINSDNAIRHHYLDVYGEWGRKYVCTETYAWYDKATNRCVLGNCTAPVNTSPVSPICKDMSESKDDPLYDNFNEECPTCMWQ
tara:strand:- start:2046 stop:2390 length:345 start_codon:yes stop_codon:yes gene_type:complete